MTSPRRQLRVNAEDVEDALVEHFHKLYPVARSKVDGRDVLPNIDNLGSIRGFSENYIVLKGVRDFPIEGFGGKDSYYSASEQDRVEKLARAIQHSNAISPIIIVEEKNGPYVLEGGHRMSALVELGAVSIPALIVVDLASWGV